MNDDSNFIKRIINDRLAQHVEYRAAQWSDEFARKADGSRDEALAHRIEREVRRRGAIGYQRDIYEPIRWAAVSGLLSAAAGTGIKLFTDKSFARPALITLLITTASNSAIQLARLPQCYDAGLRGGVDTALAMHAFDTKRQRPGGPWAAKVCASPERPAIHQFDI